MSGSIFSMIKIFVCSHLNNQNLVKTCKQHDFLQPLQVGCDTNDKYEGYLYDDDCDNISSLNPYYCELTGHYWVWKNQTADYYGFFHYRRFLDFNQTNNIYTFENSFEHLSTKYNYQNASEIIRNYDIIIPKKEKFYTDVYNHYKNADNHFIEDFELAISITQKLYPDFANIIDDYLANDELYIGNIFIMKHEIFQDYSSWLFTILTEFDKLITSKNPRANGFIAERLLGIYITKATNENAKILELPRIHFESNKLKYLLKTNTNFILPPNSKRRLMVRKFWRKK